VEQEHTLTTISQLTSTTVENTNSRTSSASREVSRSILVVTISIRGLKLVSEDVMFLSYIILKRFQKCSRYPRYGRVTSNE
jgi:hypothetical protein